MVFEWVWVYGWWTPSGVHHVLPWSSYLIHSGDVLFEFICFSTVGRCLCVRERYYDPRERSILFYFPPTFPFDGTCQHVASLMATWLVDTSLVDYTLCLVSLAHSMWPLFLPSDLLVIWSGGRGWVNESWLSPLIGPWYALGHPLGLFPFYTPLSFSLQLVFIIIVWALAHSFILFMLAP